MLEEDKLNQILDRNISWIENCDNKASIMLGTLGVAVSMIFAFDYSTIILKVINEKWKHISCVNVLFLMLIGVSLSALIFGGYKLIKTLTPKIDIKNISVDEKINCNSVIFFSSIAKHSTYTKFLEKLKKTNDADYLNDISSQIYICATICDIKFKNYKQGLFFSIGGLLSFITLISLGYFV